jgi:hypothetical protein
MDRKAKQSPGRERNDALPAAERPGLVSNEGVERTGLKETQTAKARKVGETFKRSPR